MDLVAINAYGRPLVQPSASNPATQGLRPVDDPREATLPVSPLAARNSPDLRQSVGPRQASGTTDSTDSPDEEEHGTVQGRSRPGASSAARPRRHLSEGDERGASVDVTV